MGGVDDTLCALRLKAFRAFRLLEGVDDLFVLKFRLRFTEFRVFKAW